MGQSFNSAHQQGALAWHFDQVQTELVIFFNCAQKAMPLLSMLSSFRAKGFSWHIFLCLHRSLPGPIITYAILVCSKSFSQHLSVVSTIQRNAMRIILGLSKSVRRLSFFNGHGIRAFFAFSCLSMYITTLNGTACSLRRRRPSKCLFRDDHETLYSSVN